MHLVDFKTTGDQTQVRPEDGSLSNTHIMISKGMVSKGQYSKFGTVKGFQYSF